MKRRSRMSAVLLLVAAVLTAPATTGRARADSSPVSPPAQRHNVSVGGVATKADDSTRAHGSTSSQHTPQSPSTTVVPVSNDIAGATALATEAFDGGGLVDASFVTAPPAYATHGMVKDLGGFPSASAYGALLTTGDARWAAEDNDYGSSGRDSGGGIVRGARTYDVTVLKATFDVPAGMNCFNMSFRFYSEEVPEFTGKAYNDAFIAEIDTDNWTTTASTVNAPSNFAHDGSGNLVSANTSGPLGMSAALAAGSTYDGATPVLIATTSISPGRHTLYLSLFDQYDAVYDSAVVVDQIRYTNVATCPTGTGAQNRPIIFVPGIMGSFLEDGDGNEVWPNQQYAADPWDFLLKDLKLNNDGYTACCGVKLGRRGMIAETAGTDVYRSTVEHLMSNGYVLDRNNKPEPNETLFLYPFDWRRSAQANATALLQLVDRIRDVTGHDKVNILAHSQGGLVVRAMLSLAGSYGRVNRVVTLGTPNLGAALAISVMKYKLSCMPPASLLGGCILNRDTVRDVAQNFSGLLELLPSDPYYWAIGSPIVRKYDADGDGQIDGRLDEGQVFALFNDTSQHNPSLILAAQAWHDSHDLWNPVDSSVGLVRVFGYDYLTPQRINLTQDIECDTGDWAPPNCYALEHAEFDQDYDGDGVVPKGSATMVNPVHDLTGGRPSYGVRYGHNSMVLKKDVIDYAVAVMRVNGPTNAITADPTTFAVTGAVAPASFTQHVDPPDGIEITVAGNTHGLVTDADGWRTGVTDAATGWTASDIPGSTYHEAPAYATVGLTTETTGTATGRWTVTAPGDVRIRVYGYTDGVKTSLTPYPPIRAAAGAVLTLADLAVPMGTAPAVAVDDDGDGDVDRTVAPMPTVTGAAVTDLLKPVSSASLAPFTAGNGTARVHVTLTATDDTGGCGIGRIEWQHAASGTSALYSGTPLDLPRTGTLAVRAIDCAGNVQAPYLFVNLAA
ncbi:alpha/beta fold hydrolase [Catellatospora chokoriensis]|uniref:Lecithin:cholesterol acyltransferase n=1 Tax=Catellatospora chokoriensis TaxID=310353 RepID=A0A8J3JZ63_9ACTN|nr:alpha/beta fold hydrolase [Catellatospora chokoriensis]GIF93786.1 hypothetical protein Cch02nite_72300 [Catellatospora chokoriensis]